MKIFLSTIITLVLLQTSFAQNLDENLVTYNSEYERELFKDIKNRSNLELLLGVGDHMTDDQLIKISAEIQKLKNQLVKKRFAKETPKNQAKVLRNILHGKVLKKYKSISPFYRIFEDGQYNCVSSTALYALLLDEFNIPYIVKELPTHVYIVMYPDNARVEVQTTTPKKGVYAKTDFEIHRSVSILLRLGVLDKEDVKNKGTRESYYDYFYEDSGISLPQLVGDQYSNEAIAYMVEEDTTRAISAILKANHIYPSKRNGIIKLEILEVKLRKFVFNDINDISLLKEYCNVSDADIDKVKYKYSNFLNDMLIVGGKKSFIDTAYSYLSHEVSDSLMLNAISEIHYSGLSEYYYKARNYKKSLKFSLKVLGYNPENKFNLSVATEGIANEVYSFDLDDYYDQLTDEEYDDLIEEDELYEGEMRIQILEKYLKNYPCLKGSTTFKALHCYIYAEISEDAYSNNDEEKATRFFNKALEQIKRIEDPELISEEMLGYMYSSAGAYFYRQDELEKALKVINDGLEVSPDHPRLVAKKKIIKNAMNN